MIRYIACPGCGSGSLRFVLNAKDHTVSRSVFEIWECNQCSLRFTQDAPDSQMMHAYYRSEDYISHSDTGKGWVNRLYHQVRKKTLRAKYRIVSNTTGKNQGKLLDLGAGTGSFVSYMQEKGWQVTGLEPDEGARRKAGLIHQTELFPVDYLGTLEEGSFDAITLWHVLEHVHALHQDIEKLKKILREAGRIIIAVPNYTSYDASFYNSNWAAYDVPRHLYHFSPLSMKQLLLQHDLKLQSIRPMWYDSFYISLLSEQYKKGKTNVVGGVFRGAVSNCKALLKTERCSSLIYIAGK